MTFMQGILGNLQHLMHFVVEYVFNFGQLVKKSKSLVFFGKFALLRQRSIATLLGIGLGSFPFKYLRVPFFQGHPLRIYFQEIADKVK